MALSFAATVGDTLYTLYTLYTFGTYCVSALFDLWREVSTRITQVLAKFSPMIHARPDVQIVRVCAHMATFMRRSLSRRDADYLRIA